MWSVRIIFDIIAVLLLIFAIILSFRKKLKVVSKIVVLIFAVVFLSSIVLQFLKGDYKSNMLRFTNSLEKGISQKSVAVLNPICAEGISQNMLDEIYKGKKADHTYVTDTRFAYARSEGKKVECRAYSLLRDEKDTIPNYWIKFYLKERLDGWRIESFETGFMDRASEIPQTP